MSVNPQAKIVDITHDIAPQNLQSASFTLEACYRDFPPQTIFVAVVDPGVGSNRRAILVEAGKYFFVAPDNGLLSFIFDETENLRVFELTNKHYFKQSISQTFHGRDVFAPVAAHLSKNIEANKFGREITDFVRLSIKKPSQISQNETEAEIIHVDKFGNLITNLTKNDLTKRFTLEINDVSVGKHLEFFAQAVEGELFTVLGSAGFLEIAAYKDSAKNILSVKIGDRVSLKKIK